jgi:hypothetical protein
MRIRLFGLAVAAQFGVASFAISQQAPIPLTPQAPAALAVQPAAPPTAAPQGMMPVPVAPPGQLPATAPIVVQGQPGCGTAAPVAPTHWTPAAPAPAPCAPAPASCAPAPAASSSCATTSSKGSSLLGRLFIGSGTANPVSCGCFASERSFVFGSCRQFYTPGRACDGSAREYGCGSGECGGGIGAKDNCKHVTSFHNR